MLVELSSIVLVVPQVVVVGLLRVVGSLGYIMGQIYLSAQLGVKRHVSNARAPILAHLGAAVGGLVFVRAYNAQELFISQSFTRLDNYSRAKRPYENLMNWVSARLDILGGCFQASLAAYMVHFSASSAAEIGFCLAQAAAFSTQILWFVYSMNEFELSANSFERIQAYVDAEKEPPSTPAGTAYWPASGDLRVENLSARYAVGGPKVLEDVSFHVRSGERVGIVGRTGSGKSSLTLSLLRCIPTEGSVYFDGIRTTVINLDALRNSITIIPQMPELLNATLRRNLDPFERYSDQELNDALRAAGLFSLNEDEDQTPDSDSNQNGKWGLDTAIASGGGNMSVGERQIVALARALVRRSKVLILDEATSAIDYKTDAIIQKSLRTEVSEDTTLLIIAHRLQTIMDADKILVLDSGRLVEFGTPKELISKENGKLRSLIHESADRDVLIASAMADKEAGKSRGIN